MKNLIFLPLLLFCCLLANGQNYLQQANACFDKGDYENAKKNYTLFKEFDGSKDVSAQIQMSDKCLRTMNLADDYFKDREYAKARDHYKTVLDMNPKDLNAKKQYDLCVAQLNRSVPNTPASQVSPANTQHYSSEPEMVFVQDGTFTIGYTPEEGADCYDNEKPAHQVTLSSFYIGKYEVTQAQWKAVMGNNPSHFKGDNLPVEQVSWKDVQEFIRKLNAQTGKQYRLPTEAEWEYAARGGNKSQGYKYSGSNTTSNVAWYYENAGYNVLDDKTWNLSNLNSNNNRMHPVGTKSPNELGIYDMSGNVWEWCQDWYGTYPSSPRRAPVGFLSGSYRVFRGGGWDGDARGCSVSYRSSGKPDLCNNDLGFRIACSSK